jgi:hypothetical protein
MKFYTEEEGGVATVAETSGISRHHGYMQQADSPDRFQFWLVVTLLAIFILLLFYSQKIHGLT